MSTFGTRLHDAMATRGRLCVGIDPHAALLRGWGLDDDVAGLERFALSVVEAVAPVASVVKPQSAFYERFGSRGIAVLERVVAESRAAGALVLLDVKRGDIGSTSQAYADAYLPFVDTARRHDAGVFVLALTSNPEGPEVQHAVGADGVRVADRVLDHLRGLNADAGSLGSLGQLGSFGAVVGATIAQPEEGPAFDLATGGPVLAPGFGAQGGTVDDLRRIFGASASHVLASSSREVLGLGPDRLAMRDAVRATNDELAALG